MTLVLGFVSFLSAALGMLTFNLLAMKILFFFGAGLFIFGFYRDLLHSGVGLVQHKTFTPWSPFFSRLVWALVVGLTYVLSYLLLAYLLVAFLQGVRWLFSA